MIRHRRREEIVEDIQNCEWRIENAPFVYKLCFQDELSELTAELLDLNRYEEEYANETGVMPHE